MHSSLCTTLPTKVSEKAPQSLSQCANQPTKQRGYFYRGDERQGKAFLKIKDDFSSKPRTVAEGFRNINTTNLSIPGDKGYVS